MSYSEIFLEIYKKNKRAIHIYIIAALTFAIFLSGDGNIVYATAAAGTAGAITALGGEGGTLLVTLFQAMGISVDVSTGLAIAATVSIALDVIPKEILMEWGFVAEGIEISFRFFDMWWIRAICYIWFIVSKLVSVIPPLNFASGVCEYIETKIGQFIPLLVGLANAGLIFSSGTFVHAATTPETILTGDIVSSVLSVFIIFLALVSLLVVYVFVRTFFFFIRIILLPFYVVVPPLSFIVGAIKSIIILGLGVSALSDPQVFLFLYILIVLISMAFFKKAYITIRYFKNIYVKPFFRKFKGYDDISLITTKCPKKVRNHLADKNVDILMPVYLMKKIPEHKYAKRYDRWWFVSSESKQWICKPKFMSDSCYRIEINDIEEKNIFIQKSLRFFEIFSLKDSQNIGKKARRVHKKIHIVFSKEYLYRFENIKEITGFADYKEYTKEIQEERKLSRIEQKEEKRLQRLALKEERKLAKKKS